MSARQTFAWALGALVDGADLLPVHKSVALMREAARLIAESGALPVRCDNAAHLFRQMIAEEAAGAPFPITEVMVEAYRAAIVSIEQARNARQRRRA
jgi:hypothetical protein